MTRKIKVYKIPLPFSIKEWRKGSRYLLSKMTNEDVKIVIHQKEKGNEEHKIITHKIIDVSKNIPYMIKKVIPIKAMILDEYSVNVDSFKIGIYNENGVGIENEILKINSKIKNDKNLIEKKIKGIIEKKTNCEELNIKEENIKKIKENIEIKEEMLNYCETKYKNKKYDTETFNLQVNTLGSKKELNNAFKLDCEYKEVEIDFKKYGKKKIEKIGMRDYSGDWTQKFPIMYLYKYVDVEINSFGFGWITKEIDKIFRNFLIDIQLKIIESYDEWIDLSYDDLELLENEMVNKYLVK